jgi:DNA-directed RNA polymerase subunit M/transcription elongation factor TFIIS
MAAREDRHMLAPLADVARFTAQDPDTVVEASFACPICLHGEAVTREASLDGYDPSVSCECPECHVSWRVYLTPEQALRLGLMPAHAV